MVHEYLSSAEWFYTSNLVQHATLPSYLGDHDIKYEPTHVGHSMTQKPRRLFQSCFRTNLGQVQLFTDSPTPKVQPLLTPTCLISPLVVWVFASVLALTTAPRYQLPRGRHYATVMDLPRTTATVPPRPALANPASPEFYIASPTRPTYMQVVPPHSAPQASPEFHIDSPTKPTAPLQPPHQSFAYNPTRISFINDEPRWIRRLRRSLNEAREEYAKLCPLVYDRASRGRAQAAKPTSRRLRALFLLSKIATPPTTSVRGPPRTR